MTASGAADAGTQRYAATATLRDGGSISIRAIRPDDKARLLDHFHALSARSGYFRFLAAKKPLTDEELREFTELDFAAPGGAGRDAARQAEDERIIGVGRYAVAPDDARPRRGRRSRSPTSTRAAASARCCSSTWPPSRARHGITEFEADVLGENNQMLERLRGRAASR